MKKVLFGLVISATLLVMSTGAVFAQDPTPPPPVSGIVQSITIETDESGEITIGVEFLDEAGDVRTVRISLDTALELGLVESEMVETYIVAVGAVGSTVSFDPEEILEEAEEGETEDGVLHPVASALSDFFSSLLGVDYETVMAYHEDGIGFGVIAQALWMTKSLEGDTAILQIILDAKKSGDFSALVLPDGSSPTNWGQFRQAILKDKEKAKNNLGAIKSGKADNESTTEDELNSTDSGKGNNKGNKDKDKDKGKGKDD